MPIKIERDSRWMPSIEDAQLALRTKDFVDAYIVAAATEQDIGAIREAIANGDIQVVRFGRNIRIPTAPLRKAWGLD